MMQAATPELYLNMQQFSRLKLQANKDSNAASQAVSRQFEGLFVQMMLKNMRSAAVMDKSQHSSYMDFYTEMYDKQLAMTLSQQGGIGIARMMQQQMQRYLPERQATADVAADKGNPLPVWRLPVGQKPSLPMARMDYVAVNPAVKTHQYAAQPQALDETAAPALRSETIKPFYGWSKASAYVQDIWPHAQKAAAKLGVSPAVLVAQSALETGWGRHAMRKDDGSIAFNLFGVKAGSNWVGSTVSHKTLEFHGGAMQQERASFRAYDSLSDAFDDYVSFVQSHPRYAQALKHADSDSRYVHELQRAGYATDPDYARKIENIIHGDTMKQALAQLAAHQPTGADYA